MIKQLTSKEHKGQKTNLKINIFKYFELSEKNIQHQNLCDISQTAVHRVSIALHGVGWGGRQREVQEGGDICIPMVDSCRCMIEANTALETNYPPIKKEKKYLKSAI